MELTLCIEEKELICLLWYVILIKKIHKNTMGTSTFKNLLGE